MELCDRVASIVVEARDLWAIGEELIFEALIDGIKIYMSNSSGGLNKAKLS